MYINNLSHMTKMATMPIYGKNPSNIFFSETNRLILMKLGVKHPWTAGILIILKKENGQRASSAPALGLNTIIFKHVYWYMQQTQVSVYRTIGPLVGIIAPKLISCMMTTKRGSKKSSRGGKSARAPGLLSALQDDAEEVTFFLYIL